MLPDIPTFKEAGVPEFEYDSWFGILALAGTPKEIVAKVSADVAQVLQMPEVKNRFEPQGAFLVSTSPVQFDQILKNDAQRYAGLFRDQN